MARRYITSLADLTNLNGHLQQFQFKNMKECNYCHFVCPTKDARFYVQFLQPKKLSIHPIDHPTQDMIDLNFISLSLRYLKLNYHSVSTYQPCASSWYQPRFHVIIELIISIIFKFCIQIALLKCQIINNRFNCRKCLRIWLL